MGPSSIFSVVVAVVGLWSFLRLVSSKYGRKLPPGPRPLPIIGHLHMLGDLPHRALYKLSLKYGPIMSIRLGNVPTIVVSSPQNAELILKTHDSIFANRPKAQSSQYMSYGSKGITFTPYGSYWRNIRKICTLQLLSGSKTESFVPTRREEIGVLVESVKKAAVAREVVDMRAKVGGAIENVMFRMIFGRSYSDELDLKDMIKEGMTLSGVINLADFFPFVGAFDFQGLKQRMNTYYVTMEKILNKILDEHEKRLDGTKQDNHSCFVDALLSMKNQPINPNDDEVHIIDRNSIKAITLDMIAGSFGTSVAAIEWAFAELLRHPRVMTRLQDEIKSVVGMDKMVEEKDLVKLPYLDMVVKESMRLHPVGPLLVPHEAMEDTVINGYNIPKKTRVIVNIWAIGRDPDAWSKNAEEFYPERFVDSKLDIRGRDFELIPFGSGRRMCPGLNLGLITVRIVIAQLVHCFNWDLPDGMLPSELDMSEKFGLTLPRANHLNVIPSYRIIGQN